jgi:hypothetical protein
MVDNKDNQSIVVLDGGCLRIGYLDEYLDLERMKLQANEEGE